MATEDEDGTHELLVAAAEFDAAMTRVSAAQVELAHARDDLHAASTRLLANYDARARAARRTRRSARLEVIGLTTGVRRRVMSHWLGGDARDEGTT